MPLTLSHPAAVVPLARWGFVLSALIVGSMSPDFLYFYCLSARCQFGHTLLGIFLFDIPAGLVVLWIFHRILKQPLFSLFPISHQQRLMPFVNEFQFFPLRSFLLIIISLLIGILTHIIWDSFTHKSGWVVQQLPVLGAPLVETNLGTLKVYKVLQYASTFLGAALLFYWYLKWLKTASQQPINSVIQLSTQVKSLIILVMGLIAAIGASIYGLSQVTLFSDFYSFYKFVGFSVIAGIAILCIELVIFSVIWHFKKLKH
jgi:hypothetical protein